MSLPALPLIEAAPCVPLEHLDTLWFQVAGTLCNLECKHCFISCSPHNHTFGFLTLETVRAFLDQSVQLGVKEYYFTGGEPFLNREMTAILELSLQYGPTTVLTNATVFKPEWLQRLRRAEDSSIYSLEFRVSIDGFSAEQNDPVRGPGTFARALHGIRLLVEHGFLPIVTVTRTDDTTDDGALFSGFETMLRTQGYSRPRIKILPTLRIGAESTRRRGYTEDEYVTHDMMAGFDHNKLVCSHSRLVSDRGVFVCPILLDSPEARLGRTLNDALESYPLRHRACYTCYQYGSLCANPTAGGRNA